MKKTIVLLTALLFQYVAYSQNRIETLDVMTFNVRLKHNGDKQNGWQYRKENVAEMIRYFSPDILGTQEVLHEQLNDLKRSLPAYTSWGVGRSDGETKGEYCAIFYKTDQFEFVDGGNFSLSESPNAIGTIGWDAACERIVTWVVLKERASERTFAVFNTHLDHVGTVARGESAKLIVKKIKEMADSIPVVLMGDFNAELYSDPLILLQSGGLHETRMRAPVVYGPEWSFHNFGRISVALRPLIDFIFTTENVLVLTHRIIDEKPIKGYLSDHAPIMTTLILP